MKRRDSLKTLLIGGIAGATIPLQGCKTDTAEKAEAVITGGKTYGRTPSTPTAGSATEAEVPEFIEFIVKDLPSHQLPIRGGLMWLNGESTKRFNKTFADCNHDEQISIVDDIAYPDPENKKPEMGPGISFFNRMRNLTMTGYYTTKMGIDDLGYVGNRPNLWDGVPQEILDKRGLSYPKEWMPKFVNHETRDVQAEWDEQGNLIT